MEIENIIISGAVTIVSVILLLVAIHSYRISGNKKLRFVIMVFLFFLLKGILLSFGLIYEPLMQMITSYHMGIVDLIILTFLYTTALKR